jgi:excisionase family DNA binding protein
LLTVVDVARLLRLSKASVYKLVAQRKLPHLRIGNAIRFVPSTFAPIRDR